MNMAKPNNPSGEKYKAEKEDRIRLLNESVQEFIQQLVEKDTRIKKAIQDITTLQNQKSKLNHIILDFQQKDKQHKGNFKKLIEEIDKIDNTTTVLQALFQAKQKITQILKENGN